LNEKMEIVCLLSRCIAISDSFVQRAAGLRAESREVFWSTFRKLPGNQCIRAPIAGDNSSALGCSRIKRKTTYV
jgi:hypothetical protein